MADDVSTEQQPKKKRGFLKWIILLVLLLALAGGGYFAYLKFFAAPAPAPAGEAATAEQGKDAAQMATASPKDAQIVTLPTFLVNLADPLGRRYLKMTLDVELVNQAAADELNTAQPKVRDKIILLLSSKSYTELASMESKLLLKQELVERINQVLGGSKVLNVYFTELVIQ
ncbi:MAG: flagellar basal body-associated FliL family protein [Desulfovibrionaceae bacterium]|nr:flagellar basal body-associated FliL family protein [Desulfovibrionaceae bacterium]